MRELQGLLTHLRREIDATCTWVEDWRGVRVANPALTALTLEELAVVDEILAFRGHAQHGPLAQPTAVAIQSSSTFEHWDGTPTGGIAVTLSPDKAVVRLTGDIDLSVAEEFGRLLLSLPTARGEIVLDVSDLAFADSTLVNFVAAVHAQLLITIAPPNRWVLELLQLVGLLDRVADAV